MTIETVATLTELERDALGEIANIAMARAATSIRQMVGHQVFLSVPAVEILAKEAAAQTSLPVLELHGTQTMADPLVDIRERWGVWASRK
jgi:chemotaxis protein CheY-P-specific phosphatase CheC